MAAAEPASGRTVYSNYIDAELAVQLARKASLEQRGVAVITTSGTLVSLLFGLVAVITGVEHYTPPSGARIWLYVGLGLFVVASVLALVVNAPLVYQTVKADELKRGVTELWSDDEATAQRNVALTRIKVFGDTKTKNDIKGVVLIAAMVAEVGAVACVGAAVRLILHYGPA